MHRLTPAPSFRPSRPIHRTNPPDLMHRTRNNSPPPRRSRNSSPPPRKPIVITTEWNAFHDMPTSASPPDADLIFQMSPVLAHNDAVSPISSRFSPPIYSFPHSSNKFTKRQQEHAPAPSKTARTPTLVPPLSPRGINVTTPRPLASSIRESAHPLCRETPKNFILPNNLAHQEPHGRSPSAGSSPIPIPRPQSRGGDPRPVARPSPALFSSPSINLSPAVRYSRRTPPSPRVEGFASESDDDNNGSDTDSHTPSTAYSCGSDPFRFEKFLDDKPRWLRH